MKVSALYIIVEVEQDCSAEILVQNSIGGQLQTG